MIFYLKRLYYYVSNLAKFIGEKVNFLVLILFYLVFFGIYSLAYQGYQILVRKSKKSNWVENKEEFSSESYNYQS
jgi:hypothetical protein